MKQKRYLNSFGENFIGIGQRVTYIINGSESTMTEEEYNHLRLKIRERTELKSFYIIDELEKFRKYNIPPHIPPSPLDSAIMDYIVYGTDIAKENVLRNIYGRI